jgi:peptidoglycan hydrolase CwlO-like protein
MAATIKTLIEKAQARKEQMEQEDKDHQGLIDLLGGKIDDLEKKESEIQDQLDGLRTIRAGLEYGDSFDIEEGIEILKAVA